jgi:hypothetical protein
VGLAAVGTGGVLALLAKSRYDKAKKQCLSDGCDDGPYEDIEGARSQGTVATVVMAVGGVALAAGATLWLITPAAREQPSPASARVSIERLGLSAGGVVVGGRF